MMFLRRVMMRIVSSRAKTPKSEAENTDQDHFINRPTLERPDLIERMEVNTTFRQTITTKTEYIKTPVDVWIDFTTQNEQKYYKNNRLAGNTEFCFVRIDGGVPERQVIRISTFSVDLVREAGKPISRFWRIFMARNAALFRRRYVAKLRSDDRFVVHHATFLFGDMTLGINIVMTAVIEYLNVRHLHLDSSTTLGSLSDQHHFCIYDVFRSHLPSAKSILGVNICRLTTGTALLANLIGSHRVDIRNINTAESLDALKLVDSSENQLVLHLSRNDLEPLLLILKEWQKGKRDLPSFTAFHGLLSGLTESLRDILWQLLPYKTFDNESDIAHVILGRRLDDQRIIIKYNSYTNGLSVFSINET